MVFHDETRRNADFVSLSLLLGLSMAIIVDVVLRAGTFTIYSSNFTAFLSSVSGCVFLIAVDSINSQTKKLLDSVKRLISLQSKHIMAIKYLPLLCYVLLFIIWVYNFNHINAFALISVHGRLESMGYWYVPFYVLPIRFGVTGLIAVVGMAYYGNVIATEPKYKVFASMIVVGVFLEQLMNYVTLYPAYRLATLTLAGFAALSALVTVRFLFSKTSDTGRSLNIGFLSRKLILIFLMGIGVWSTCVYFISNMLQFGG
jgi:hypothetical protein